MLGPDLCRVLLFLHSFIGCDTTYGIGKSTSFKLFLNNPRLLQLASIFLKPEQSSDDIKNATVAIAIMILACEGNRYWQKNYAIKIIC